MGGIAGGENGLLPIQELEKMRISDSDRRDAGVVANGKH